MALAPTLVATDLGCVVRPSSVGDPDPEQPDAPTLLDARVDYETACDSTLGWAPVEDGSFQAALGEPIDPSAMTVSAPGEAGRTSLVNDVVRSAATSRCTPGLALLLLARGLDVPPVPIRLEEVTSVEEPVLLGGHCVLDGEWQRRVLSSTVQSQTLASGNADVPPQSLLLSGGTLGTDLGGAVFSVSTGALLGLISSTGPQRACGEEEAAVKTTAIRLAVFRTMLLETAREEGIELRSEMTAGPAGIQNIAPCSEPAADGRAPTR